MTSEPQLDPADIEQLRQVHYNATLTRLRHCHDELIVFGVRPDRGVPPFEAGQYTTLGLGYWEPRVEGVQEEELEPAQFRKVVRRAYSVSCPLLADGQLVRPSAGEDLEFYVTLVRYAKRPPALTPRLFALQEGDRIQVGTHFHGHYTLQNVRREDNVVFAGTGTGEAPHNAMLAELLSWNHQGHIASVICVRHRQDLGYLKTHRQLESRFANYRYLPLTTREPENLDASHPDYVGKRYLQDYFESGDFEREAGFALSPENTHVFLCGGPEMIGVPKHTHDPAERYPEPKGMVEVLERRFGFVVDAPHEPGNIHFEKYW